LPLFQRRIAIGSAGFPFNLSEVTYQRGLCPVAERMHFDELLCFETCAYVATEADAALLIRAFRKVHANSGNLAGSGLG
jgi:perosamine synthetase